MDEIDAIRSMINEKKPLFGLAGEITPKPSGKAEKKVLLYISFFPEDEEKRIQELQGPGLRAQRIGESS